MDETFVNTPEDQMELQPSSDMQQPEEVVMDEVKDNDTGAQYTGQCKWFNNSYGYGFLTVCDGPEKGTDIFVHWEGIKPLNSLYKTLKKGEYVIFDVLNSDKGKQAVNVRGICNGPLLCDHLQIKKTNGPAGMPPQELPPGPNAWNTIPNRKPRGVPVVPGVKRQRLGRPVDSI